MEERSQSVMVPNTIHRKDGNRGGGGTNVQQSRSPCLAYVQVPRNFIKPYLNNVVNLYNYI